MTSLAQKHAQKGHMGRMEGHAAMDMSVDSKGTFLKRLLSQKGFTAISEYFVMDWVSVWTDILLGFLIAGALTVLVPHPFWQAFFLTSDPTLAFIEGPLVGPLVAVISFVCSVGNIPLAAVLWSGGISFGGVVSFIFADLLILPLLNIYRKYYGWKVAAYMFFVLYTAMVLAGYATEILFSLLHIIPKERSISFALTGIHWNYTTFLNICFLIIALILIYRFVNSGGISMLKMMDSTHHHEK